MFRMWRPTLSSQSTGHPHIQCADGTHAELGALTCVQDFFDLGLLPAATDFSVFAHPDHMALPGLDIAFLLDASAYHTDRDTVDRIKPGTLQVRAWQQDVVP